MSRFWSSPSLALVFALVCCCVVPVRSSEPETTMEESEQVLGELLAIPGKRISQNLLAEAQAVVIVPRVIKIGFVAGVRRGHGVVLVRDAEGDWSLPQFLTLTGGSVGWQAGVQGTDVVLIFTTRKSVEGLLKGKFTIGVDASASAGPVGRNAAAATDAKLKAEILSYSRSRGLFVGAAIDGSALEIDPGAQAAFYGSAPGAMPLRIPTSAGKLREYLVELTGQPSPIAVQTLQPAGAMPGTPGATAGKGVTGGSVSGGLVAGGTATTLAPLPQPAPPEVVNARRMQAIRSTLNRNAVALQGVVSPEWQRFLAMPREIADPALQPTPELLDAVFKRYAGLAQTPAYQGLTDAPEFRATFELIEAYREALAAQRPVLRLPPPPAG